MSKDEMQRTSCSDGQHDFIIQKISEVHESAAGKSAVQAPVAVCRRCGEMVREKGEEGEKLSDVLWLSDFLWAILITAGILTFIIFAGYFAVSASVTGIVVILLFTSIPAFWIYRRMRKSQEDK